MDNPTPEELREARRQSLLQRHIDGRRLTAGEREEIADLITEAAPTAKGRRAKAGRPNESLRWTIEKACREFKIDRKTLTIRLAQSSILAAADTMYSTADITRCVFGDIEGERLGKIKAERVTAEVNAAKALNQVLLVADAESLWLDAATRSRQAIESANYLDDSQKARVLKMLENIKLSDETVTLDAP